MSSNAQPATLRPYVRSAEPGNSFWYVGQLMSALAEGEDTGGRLTVYEILFPPDSGPPLHVHEREDEAFYVIEGGLSVRMGDEDFKAPAPGASCSSLGASRTPSGPPVTALGCCCWWYRVGSRVTSTS